MWCRADFLPDVWYFSFYFWMSCATTPSIFKFGPFTCQKVNCFLTTPSILTILPYFFLCLLMGQMGGSNTTIFMGLFVIFFPGRMPKHPISMIFWYSTYFACNNDLCRAAAVLTNLLGDILIFLSFLPDLSLEEGI